MPTTLHLTRHGETDYNLRRIVQGSGVDSVLNGTGKAQARALYEAYGEVEYDHIYYSALKRTKETLAHFLTNTDIPSTATPALNEINWGVHEGRASTPEGVEQYRALAMAWKMGHYHCGLEGGESAQQLADRLQPIVGQLHRARDQRILLCTHGRTAVALLCLLQRLPLKHMGDYKVANTGVYVLEQHLDRFVIKSANNVDHLTALDVQSRDSWSQSK